MTRKNMVFVVLGGFFLTNAIVAELIGGKLIFVGGPALRIGPLGPFKMSVAIIAYVYLILVLTSLIPAEPEGPNGVDDASYNRVFGQSRWIIVGSILAFLTSQLIDVSIFHLVRQRTGKAFLWLRSTGSTIISQIIDSVIVLYIGLAIPLELSFQKFVNIALPNYLVKLVVALLMTPLIYLGHWLVELYLGKPLAESIAEEAALEGAVAE